MAISIADKLAALRAARAQPLDSYAVTAESVDNRVYLPDGSLSIHDDIFRAFLEQSGRDDIDYLMTRPVDERGEILRRIEINPREIMRFLDADN